MAIAMGLRHACFIEGWIFSFSCRFFQKIFFVPFLAPYKAGKLSRPNLARFARLDFSVTDRFLCRLLFYCLYSLIC